MSARRRRRAWWETAARLGLGAWFFGNLYEGLAGMPQLLEEARSRRAPGIVRPGSPVRYYAPVAPLAFGGTLVTLAKAWQSDGDRCLIKTTAASVASAAALSVYLIWRVNVPLLASGEALSEDDRHQMVATWHSANAARLGALIVGGASLSRLTSERVAISRPAAA